MKALCLFTNKRVVMKAKLVLQLFILITFTLSLTDTNKSSSVNSQVGWKSDEGRTHTAIDKKRLDPP